ncbi:hypothetical protein LSM04_001937 [Trypanosoma melophagium]|uniref:uncharacterized protein n=1 Tax=Trypanosoma melophagium TaxID=715481 RepID=UPI00351A8EA4|nr:hypothetical protein LSM04_001937 [Trypanosoma melophagium]
MFGSKNEELTCTRDPSAMESDGLTQTHNNEGEEVLGPEDVKAEEERQRNNKILEELVKASYAASFTAGGNNGSLEGKLPGRLSK